MTTLFDWLPTPSAGRELAECTRASGCCKRHPSACTDHDPVRVPPLMLGLTAEASACATAILARVDPVAPHIKNLTLTSNERLHTAARLWAAALARDTPGAWVETGVFKGGTSLLAAEVLRAAHEAAAAGACRAQRERVVWLFDSFEGFPEAREMDRKVARTPGRADGLIAKGMLKRDYSIEGVRASFAARGFAVDGSARGGVRVRFERGWFSETVPRAPVGPVALLRLDGDLYTSTMDVLVPLYPRVETEGYVIVDDYGHFIQCRRAVHDYLGVPYEVTAPAGRCCVGGPAGTPKLRYPDWMRRIDYTATWFRKRDAPAMRHQVEARQQGART